MGTSGETWAAEEVRALSIEARVGPPAAGPGPALGLGPGPGTVALGPGPGAAAGGVSCVGLHARPSCACSWSCEEKRR